MSITLFEHFDCGGKCINLNGPDNCLGDQSFNDCTSSVVVKSGKWNLFQHYNYGGQCWTVSSNGGPNCDGRYPRPEDWGGTNDAISSAKPA